MLSNNIINYFIRFAIFFLFIIFVIIALFGIYKILFFNDKNEFFYYVYSLVAIINLTFIFFIFFKDIKTKFFLSVSYILFFIIMYFTEFLIVYTAPINTNMFEVYETYKKENYNFVPHFRKRLFDTNNSDSGFPGKIYTLGGISNVGLIMTNENRFYPMSHNDQFGWNNTDVNYNNFEAALIGDSFVQGYSVKIENNIVSNLRSKNINAISIGFATNGPLIMFASFKEYVKPFKPKKIIWFYTDDDFFELQTNLKNKYLIKYLNENSFTQNLIERQNEVDILMTEYALKSWEHYRKIHVRRKNIKRMIKLSNVRERLKLYSTKPEAIKIKNIDVENLNQKTYEKYDLILKKIKENAHSWDGKLYFVYIPSKLKFKSKNLYDENLKIALNIAKKNNVPILNIEDKIVEKIKDPLSLYSVHFNKKGYKFVADEIALFISNK